MTIGSVLGEAWKLYTQFFVRFAILALIVFAVVDVVYALLAVALESGSGDDTLTVDASSVLLAAASFAASLVGTYWLQGALVFAVQDARDGTFDASTRELFRRARPFLGTLILAGLLGGLGIAVGLVLLIVPGLILMTIWALLAPTIVLEGKGVGESFGRSRELVRGHGWTVFAIILITAILSGIAAGILRGVFSFLPLFLEIVIGSTVAQAIVAPFAAIAITLVYLQVAGTPEASDGRTGSP
jgi:hypothetical protein